MICKISNLLEITGRNIQMGDVRDKKREGRRARGGGRRKRGNPIIGGHK